MTDKQVGRKKWRVNSVDGPLILAAELLKKKMLQHRYPCDYSVTPEGVTFTKGKKATDARFADTLAIAARIVNADLRVSLRLFSGEAGPILILEGEHEVTSENRLRKAKKEKLSDLAKAKQPTR